MLANLNMFYKTWTGFVTKTSKTMYQSVDSSCIKTWMSAISFFLFFIFSVTIPRWCAHSATMHSRAWVIFLWACSALSGCINSAISGLMPRTLRVLKKIHLFRVVTSLLPMHGICYIFFVFTSGRYICKSLHVLHASTCKHMYKDSEESNNGNKPYIREARRHPT